MNTYKAFQLEEFDLKFSLVNADLINGTIPASQREKCDQIKIWQESLYTSTSTLMVIATLSLLSSTTRNIMWWGLHYLGKEILLTQELQYVLHEALNGIG